MRNDWRFDPWSALAGLLVGLLIAFLYARLREPIIDGWQNLRERVAGLRRWLSVGVEGRYREEIADYAQNYHLGVGAAQLGEIFVSPRFLAPLPEPSLEEDAILPKSQISFLWPDLAAQMAIEPPETLTLNQLLTGVRRAALLAPAGGGKSTTLAYLALACAKAKNFEHLSFQPDTLPIYAHLAELELHPPGAEKTKSVEDPLLKATRSRAGTLTADTLPGVLRRALQEGRGLVLLDGWDELAPEERQPYTQWITELISLYTDNQFIVSAPLIGYGPLLDLDFVPLIMQSWGATEATKLARCWAAALNATLPTVRESQRPGARHIPALDFWQAGMPPLETTMNLWLMLAGESPTARPASCYGASIHHLLDPFGEEAVNWPLEIAHQVLGSVAHEMDEAETRIVTRTQLDETIHLVLSQREGGDGKAAQTCTRVLAEFSGLLIPQGQERLVFQSPSIFSYFWAYQLATNQDLALIQSKSRNPEWSPALSFFAEMADADSIVKEMLAAPGDVLQENLFQAARWSAHAQGKERWMRTVLISLAKLLLDNRAPLALRERAVATLVETQDKGVSYLLRQAASSENPDLRAAAALGLGALATELPGRPGDRNALEALIKALQDPSEKVQMAAIHALSITRTEASEEVLIHTLLEASPPLRRTAAESLARMGETGYQILQEALEETDTLVRRAALAGLELIDEPWVDELLDEIQRKDTEWLVRSAAEEQIKRRQERADVESVEPVRADSLTWLISWAAQQGEGVPTGPAAVALLQRVLKEGEPELAQAAAARSLGDMGQSRFIKPLSATLRSPSIQVREAAFFALAAIGRAHNQRVALG